MYGARARRKKEVAKMKRKCCCTKPDLGTLCRQDLRRQAILATDDMSLLSPTTHLLLDSNIILYSSPCALCCAACTRRETGFRSPWRRSPRSFSPAATLRREGWGATNDSSTGCGVLLSYPLEPLTAFHRTPSVIS